jgi:ABC-type nitrate/sulfonate/bicarbonate transport system substrate-binding protein
MFLNESWAQAGEIESHKRNNFRVKTSDGRIAMRKSFTLALLFLCLLKADSVTGQVQTKLNVAYSAISGVNTGLWVAAETKSFEKYGLEVNLVYIPTALQVVRVMLSGDSQISFAGGGPVVSADLGGMDFVIIGGVANVPAFYLMALPEIKTVEDLKGRVVGVSRYGSSTDFVIRYVLQKHGLQPEKDVTILQVGGMPELAAAISKGLIVAAAFSAPTNVRAKNAGAKVLVDMAKAGVSFPHTAIITRRGYLKANPKTLLNFLKGYSEGIQKMISDKLLAMKVIRKYTRDSDEEIIEGTYQYALDYIVRPPYPTRDGIIEILKLSKVPEAKKAGPDNFVDSSLVKSLEDAGFFKQVGLQK